MINFKQHLPFIKTKIIASADAAPSDYSFLDGYISVVRRLSTHPNHIIVHGDDGIQIWDTKSRQVTQTLRKKQAFHPYLMELNPEETQVFVQPMKPSEPIHCIDMKTGETIQTYRGSEDGLDQFWLTHNGTRLTATFTSEKEKIWDIQTGDRKDVSKPQKSHSANSAP